MHLQNQVTSLQGDLDSIGANSPGRKKKAKKHLAQKDEILDDTVSGSKSRSKARKRKVGEIVEVDDEGDSDGKLARRPRMSSSSDEESPSADEIDLENYFTKPEVEKLVAEIYERFKVEEEKFKVVQEETQEKFARIQKQVDANETWLQTTEDFAKAVKSQVI